MIRALSIGFILLCLFLKNPAKAQEITRIALPSDGVEVEGIHSVRRSTFGGAKEADLTNLRLGLWFSADWRMKDGECIPLIHIQTLSLIEDSTGRLLLTQKRLKQIDYLRGEVRGNTWKSYGGKQGPVVSLLLDAPAREATKLKTVKGTAQVALAKKTYLSFKDLAAVNGKVLDHPNFKGLPAMKLQFSITQREGTVCARLSAPLNYASPWNLGRLQAWDIFDGENKINLDSDGTIPDGEGVTVEKSFAQGLFQDLSLRLIVLEAVENKTFDFEFHNVDLP